MKNSTPYNEVLMRILKDKNESIAYLNAALEEDDPSLFLKALKNVMQAQDLNFTEVANKAGIHRENLYRILSGETYPQINTVKKLLKGLDIELTASYV